RFEFDPELVVPDMIQSIADGAIAAWKNATSRKAEDRNQETGIGRQREQVEQFLTSQNTPLDTPITEMRAAVREKLFRGDGKAFAGLLTLLDQEYATATDSARREQLESFRGHVTCPAC